VRRLNDLKATKENPYASMIPKERFAVFTAADVLCADGTAKAAFKACAERKAGAANPSYLRGRIVIVGETGVDVDHHDTSVIGRVPGTVVQANYVEALLDGRLFVPAPSWIDYVVGFLVFMALEASLRGRNWWLSLAKVALVVGGTFLALSFTARELGYYIDPAVSILVLVFLLTRWVSEIIERWEHSNEQHAHS